MLRHIILHGLIVFFILLLAISPLLSAMAAGTIANHYDCDLDEGSIHPCIVNGNDIGETLYTMGVLGWLALGTIPLGEDPKAIGHHLWLETDRQYRSAVATMGAVDVGFTEAAVGAGITGVFFLMAIVRTTRRSED